MVLVFKLTKLDPYINKPKPKDIIFVVLEKIRCKNETLHFDNAIYKDIFTLKNIIIEDRDYDLSRFLEII